MEGDGGIEMPAIKWHRYAIDHDRRVVDDQRIDTSIRQVHHASEGNVFIACDDDEQQRDGKYPELAHHPTFARRGKR